VVVTWQGSQVLSGELRAEAVDLDGDRVAFALPQVTLTPEAGSAQYFCCYAVVNSIDDLPDRIDLVSQDGALVAELPLPMGASVSPLSSDDLLVLDISYPQVTALNSLQAPSGWSPGQLSDGLRRFYRNIVVARMPAGELPDRWWGLEAVNVIVWDKPDPALLSLAQRDALIEWVRNGGQLVIGVGPKWAALRSSDLAPILPLEGDGATIEVRWLPMFSQHMMRPTRQASEFDPGIALTTAQPAREAIRILGDSGPSGPISLFTMRLIGSGRVAATAAGLADLTSQPDVDLDKFFSGLLDLNPLTAKFKERQSKLQAASLDRIYLYDSVTQPIGLAAATAIRSLTALLFVAAYVLAATVVSWWWLRRRNLAHLSWMVFGGLAVAASGLSLVTVGALRGLSRGVRSVTIFDLEAGSMTARGVCFFGYRSPTRQRVDLSLSQQGQYLRPLAQNPRAASHYVTPARYAAIPSQATLHDVLMRATLKQFEARWQGELDGTIRADLRVDRQTGRLSAGSWIANHLTGDLQGGYLLFIDPRLEAAGVPRRAAGLTSRYRPDLPEQLAARVVWDQEVVPPSMNILVVPIPPIPAGKVVSELGRAVYDKVERALDEDWKRRLELKHSQMPDLPTLWHHQRDWVWPDSLAALVARPAETIAAVMLASTRNFYLSCQPADFDSPGPALSTDGLPDLDVTHWVMGGRDSGQAVLICWSDRPGPVHLIRNGRPQESYSGLTIYRVRVPIHYEGHPPGRGRSSSAVLPGRQSVAGQPTADGERGNQI